ncbi:hypothetical protein TNCV_2384251 [Trichonephila clavipes]|nr:hypothetical protein TNCV_2384251 [Trichonephila clavipes]
MLSIGRSVFLAQREIARRMAVKITRVAASARNGECLSVRRHLADTFYPRSNHWEVGGRPPCDKCGCRVRNCSHSIVFTTLETELREQLSGGSVVIDPHFTRNHTHR